MNKKLNKGFTLIELLVVIAIIGILSSVVLASLNTARDKGKDASAKESMSSIRASAEILYNGTGLNSYNGLCGDGSITQLTSAAAAQTGNAAVCTVAVGNASYTVYDLLKAGTYFCVDSNGNAGELANLTSGYSAGVKCK